MDSCEQLSVLNALIAYTAIYSTKRLHIYLRVDQRNMENTSTSMSEHYKNILEELSKSLSDETEYESGKDITSADKSGNTLQDYTSSPTTDEGLGNMTDEQLRDVPVCELNGRLRDLPAEEAEQIRRRRRCLKNRSYAASSRLKRMREQDVLQKQNERLKEELLKAKAEQASVIKDRDMYKRRSECLQAAWVTLSHYVDLVTLSDNKSVIS